jgi:hypothetical protein
VGRNLQRLQAIVCSAQTRVWTRHAFSALIAFDRSASGDGIKNALRVSEREHD